jgi:hypothetical protein
VLQQVGSWLKIAADALGGWNRLVGVFIALPLLGTIASIITGFAQLAGGLVLVGSGIAALSLPVVAVVAGVAAVAAAAYLMYPLALIANNWGAITGWFASFWPGIKSLAQAGWEGLKTLFDWTPLGLIVNNWSALTEWFGSFWAGIKGLAQAEWEGFKALFAWSPLGLVINNWGSISEWFAGFWEKLKTLFDCPPCFPMGCLPPFRRSSTHSQTSTCLTPGSKSSSPCGMACCLLSTKWYPASAASCPP